MKGMDIEENETKRCDGKLAEYEKRKTAKGLNSF
jgi:hypothetical protein